MKQSTYMYMPGKSLDSPPRQEKVLIMDKQAWNGLKSWLEPMTKEQREKLERQERMQKIKEQSKAMAKRWPNTIMNVREEKMKARAERKALDEADKRERFLKIRQEHEAVRKKYMDICKQAVFYTRDAPKQLNEALKFSEALRERDAQLKFKKFLDNIEAQKEADYVEFVRKDVENFEKEKKMEKKEKEKTSKEYGQFMRDQMEQAALRKEAEKQKKKLEDEETRKLCEYELKVVDDIKKQVAEEKKQKDIKTLQEALELDRQCKEYRQKQAEEEDKIFAVYDQLQKTIARKRKEKDRQMKEDQRLLAERIAEKVGVIQESKEAEENALTEKYKAEKEDLARLKSKQERDERRKMQEEIKKYYKEQEELRERNIRKERDIKKLEKMQRDECDKQFKNWTSELSHKSRTKISSYRQTLDSQIEENKMLKVVSSDEEDPWIEQDKEFLEYSKNLIKESKEKGRLLYPMEKVIDNYKRNYQLEEYKDGLPKKLPHIPSLPKINYGTIGKRYNVN